MKKNINTIRKIFHRLFRIFTFRNGVYGKIGRKNRFKKGVYVHEIASIGSNNYFGPYAFISNAIIGNYCSIASHAKIGQSSHDISFITTYSRISVPLTGVEIFNIPTKIGNDVWIGTNAVIMQGVSIGNGAVIGASAVVTKDIPEFAVAVGVPAKILKYRFDDNIIRIIKESNWWDFEIDKASTIVTGLQDIVLGGKS